MKKAKKIIVLLMAFIILLAYIPPMGTKAADGDNLDKSGVLQINVYHLNTDTNEKTLIQTGTGFLISDSTESTQYIVTCNHVISVSDEAKSYLAEMCGITNLNIKIEVVLRGDVTEDVTVTKASEQGDFAILQLSSQVNERNAMILNPGGASQTMDVYAMGFPAAVTELQDFTYYSEDDVVVTKGSVSLVDMKIGDMPYIQHSATITAGNSGGPLVDKNGYVVGLNAATQVTDDATGQYYYSLNIGEVTRTLDILGIPYKTPDDLTGNSDTTTENTTSEDTSTTTDPSGDTTVEPVTTETINTTDLDSLLQEAKGYIEEDYTEGSYADLQAAIDAATDVKQNTAATQVDIDSAADDLQAAIDGLEKASSNQWILIAIIAAVVVIIAVIIIIVAVNSGKKKKKPAGQQRSAYSAVPPQTQPQPSPVSPSGPTGVMGQPPQPPRQNYAPQQPPVQPSLNQMGGNMNDGAGETSVLGYGAGETSVLGGGGHTHATLTRVKTNEKITITKQLFRIGKERSKVDYCIMNNNAVSRVHAELILKNGQYYIMDNNSTNYTFVNGQMIQAKQETALSNGDRIKLAEEEFIFNV